MLSDHANIISCAVEPRVKAGGFYNILGTKGFDGYLLECVGLTESRLKKNPNQSLSNLRWCAFKCPMCPEPNLNQVAEQKTNKKKKERTNRVAYTSVEQHFFKHSFFREDVQGLGSAYPVKSCGMVCGRKECRDTARSTHIMKKAAFIDVIPALRHQLNCGYQMTTLARQNRLPDKFLMSRQEKSQNAGKPEPNETPKDKEIAALKINILGKWHNIFTELKEAEESDETTLDQINKHAKNNGKAAKKRKVDREATKTHKKKKKKKRKRSCD